MMTNQEIFDTVYNGLKSQDFRQCHNGSSCRYRHDGKKCAFGHLIPDEEYDPLYEDRGARMLLDGYLLKNARYNYDGFRNSDSFEPKAAEKALKLVQVYEKFKAWGDITFSPAQYNLIDQLQAKHDDFSDPVKLEQELIAFAGRYGLTVPE